MPKTLCKILARNWQGQADYLRGLTRKELEILWNEVQSHRVTFERFYLAVHSVLRDLYEAENRGEIGGREELPNPKNGNSSGVAGLDSDFSNRGFGGRPSP